MLMRKTPRDFVHVDDLWEADDQWSQYFIAQKVWVYVDEYRAELAGDQDYSRIIVHAASEQGWMFKRPLKDKAAVEAVLKKITRPVSQSQLVQLGFTQWQGTSING